MEVLETCFVCKSPASHEHQHPFLKCDCPRCGLFWIERSLTRKYANAEYTLTQRANASGWLRGHIQDDTHLMADEWSWLMTLRTPSVMEKATKLLRELQRRYPIAGYEFKVPIGQDDLIALTWAASASELHYISSKVLGHHLEYFLPGSPGDYANMVSISPKGHAYLEDLRSGHAEDSPYGFVAMRFSDETSQLREGGIKAAIRRAGYRTTLIDEVEHLDHIDDEIIARIRRCRFLVADLTFQRQNVYYEAGFAQGLGTPVIWTCSKREIEANAPHLDVRQYALVAWSNETLNDFATKLTARIIATIGPGPVSVIDPS